jgi:hypothetical protein
MKSKVLILVCSILTIALAPAKAQWINSAENKSFNFVAPEGATVVKNEVLFPFGKSLTYTANNDTLTLTVDHFYTFYTTASDSLIANTNFFLTIDRTVTRGAMLVIEVPGGHVVRNFIPKTGFLGAAVAGVSHKTKYLTFIYNGTAFIHIGSQQID